MNKNQSVYCYVDESGHHNQDEAFIVGVVILGDERSDVETVLELIERDSKKGRTKWTDAAQAHRIAYMRRVLDLNMFHGKLFYVAYQSIDAPIIEMVARGLVRAALLGRVDAKGLFDRAIKRGAINNAKQ